MSDWSATEPPHRRRPQRGYDYYGAYRQPQQPRQAPPAGNQSQRPPRQAAAAPPRKPRKNKRVGRSIGAVLAVIVLLLAGLVLYVDSVLQRTPALADYPGRIADTPGTNWLLVGSDSREGIDPGRREELSVGDAAGRRTDTIMLMHIPDSGGKPALISLPRDSSVPVPGHGRHKLNAAFSIGGPRLLVRTVETVTGVHIDHYAEIGLGGFAKLVSAVGGVEVCLEQPIKDPKAGIDLPAGCQKLNGVQALGFVRTRNFARGDLERVENQRKLLSSLIDKATNPTTLLNPFRMYSLIQAAGDTFLVDDDDHVWHLFWLAMALGEVSGKSGVMTTVPIAGFGTLANGASVVKWDRQEALALFNAIAEDRPIPKSVLDGD